MMNERIQELAKQAGDDWDHTLESDKEFLKKFAELIVRECAKFCDDKNSKLLGTMMKEHFGVE